MILVDAHLDLAYNAINNGRNLQQSLNDLRQSEGRKPEAGIATVTIPEIKNAGIGLICGSIFALPAASAEGDPICYTNQDEAFELAMQQFDYYYRLADEDESIRLVTDKEVLQEVVDSFELGKEKLLGIIPMMEGADPVRDPQELELWVERGLKIVGLAWDDTRYSAGAWRGSRFDLTKDGYALLEIMAEFNVILDVSHMNEKASLLAIERYEGTAVATHSNCRQINKGGERHLTDQQIRMLGERGGMIGIVPYNRFLKAGHKKGDHKELVTLDHIVAHIDHICQLLGDAQHVGIGSDFDGGFGYKDIPHPMNSIVDLNQIYAKLKEKGYGEADIEGILGNNWLNLFQKSFE